LSSALNEIASVAGLRITVEEALVPISDVVRGACELLGLDPLYVANEGRFAVFVADAMRTVRLTILRSQSVSAGAVQVGTVYEHQVRHRHPSQPDRRQSGARYDVRRTASENLLKALLRTRSASEASRCSRACFSARSRPEDGSVKPVGPSQRGELQGSTTDVKDVELLQYGAPEGPPSP
jgi:hypothetical protein